MDLPAVAIVHVGERRRDAPFGHDGVRLAQERLADQPDPDAGRRRLDRRAQTGAAGADDDHIVFVCLVGHLYRIRQSVHTPIEQQADVEVREPHRKEAEPGEEHVPRVQPGRAGVARRTEFRLRDLVAAAPDQVAQRVAAERVAAEKHDVDRQDQRAQADPELDAAGAVGEPQRQPHVVGQDHDEDERQVEKVAMHVLHDQRERAFSPVALARFADRARRRVRPERLVVSAAVVVAGEAKAAGGPQDQERRRERERARPPGRMLPEPRVRTVTVEQRRVERREVRAGFVVRPLKGGPRRVDDKGRQSEERSKGLRPPQIAAARLPEAAFYQGPRGVRHRVSPSG